MVLEQMTDVRDNSDDYQPDGAQMPLHSLGQCAAALLNAVAKGVNKELASHGLTSMEFAMMRLFLTDKEWTATELAQVLPVEVSAISRMVSKLVDRGLLSRRRPKSDRRVVVLKLTDKGREVGLELHESVHSYEDRLIEGIDAHELDTFHSVINKIMANSSVIIQR